MYIYTSALAIIDQGLYIYCIYTKTHTVNDASKNRQQKSFNGPLMNDGYVTSASSGSFSIITLAIYIMRNTKRERERTSM